MRPLLVVVHRISAKHRAKVRSTLRADPAPVGIDLRWRRSVIVRQSATGEQFGCVRIVEVALREWGDNPHAVTDPDLPDDGVDQVRVLLRTHPRRERSSALNKRKLAEAARQLQAIACEVCDFDFSAT